MDTVVVDVVLSIWWWSLGRSPSWRNTQQATMSTRMTTTSPWVDLPVLCVSVVPRRGQGGNKLVWGWMVGVRNWCVDGGRHDDSTMHTELTRGKVLSWEHRSPRKRNSRPPGSVILCWVSWVENVLLIYYVSSDLLVCLHWKKIPGLRRFWTVTSTPG